MTPPSGTLWAISILGLGALPLACGARNDPSAVDAGRDDPSVVDAGRDDPSVVDAGHDDRGGDVQCLCPPGERDIRWEDLSCFCAQFSCPQLSALREPIERCVSELGSPILFRGCGRIEYSHAHGGHGQQQYQFDESTENLLAASASTDLSFGTCTEARAYKYTGGPLVNLRDCPDFSQCLNCKTVLPEVQLPACPQP